MLATISGCGGTAGPAPLADREPKLDPVVFFTGDSRGAGQLKVSMSAARTINVESHGTLDGKPKPERVRRWNLHPISASSAATGSTSPTG